MPLRLITLCLTIFLASFMPAMAAKRVALVIGNNHYTEITVLQKAVNDARAMRDALQDDLGFEVVYGEDQDQRQMNALMNDFVGRVEEGDIAFIYFSGHGVAMKSENYLTPIDVPQPSAGEEDILAGRSFGSSALIDRVQEKKAQAIFAVLDACRNNPFKVAGGKSLGGGSGLQKMDTAQGVFVLFAAGIGQEALDRINDADENPNSVFTRVLVPLLKSGGLNQYQLAKAVQTEVTKIAATIGHKQNPAYYDQIIGDVMLKEGPPPSEVDAKTDLALNTDVLPSLAEIEWSKVENSDDKEALENFLIKHGDDPVYGDKARSKLLIMSLAIPQTEAKPACEGVMAQAAGTETCVGTGYFFADCEKCPEVVVIPAGTFEMGTEEGASGSEPSENPKHQVTIAKSLAVGRFEVTRNQYLSFVTETNREADTLQLLELEKGKHPVVNVSRADAQAYADWLSTKTGLKYRLPSEAEWEYAARAGEQAAYITGETITTDSANYDRSKGGTVPVGQYAANNFGLFDMSGNVFEWTADCFVENYENTPTDGSAQTGDEGCEGVNRGSSWSTPFTSGAADFLRLAFRSHDPADTKNEYTGFRIVRDLQ